MLAAAWCERSNTRRRAAGWAVLVALACGPMPFAGCGARVDDDREPTVIVGAPGASDLTVADGYVYFTRASNGAGSVSRIAFGDPRPAVLYPSEDRPRSIAVSQGHAYWTSRRSVIRAPVDGGSSQALVASAQDPWHVAVAGPYVFFTETPNDCIGEGTVGRVTVDSGVVDVLVQGIRPCSLAVSSPRVYWAQDVRVYFMTVDSEPGEEPTLVLDDVGSVSSVAADETGLYVGSRNGVFRLSAGEVEPTALFTEAGGAALALDESSVYFASPAGVRRVSKEGGEAALLAVDETASRIAIGPFRVYWISGSRILALPKPR